MIRLTLILALVIFAVLVLVPGEDSATDAPDQAPEPGGQVRTADDSDALRERADGTLVLATESGEELVIARVIEPSELTAEDAAVNLPPAEASGALAPVTDEPQTDGEAAAPEVEAPADPTTDTADTSTQGTAAGAVRLRVTGDRVNFRAGPSTEAEILAALTQGTEVELIERVGDGWAHLRVPATGLTGYMSGDFLAPAN